MISSIDAVDSRGTLGLLWSEETAGRLSRLIEDDNSI
jgi:hypothetical protein